MTNFDEKEHDNEIFKIEYQIKDAVNEIDLKNIENKIKNYKEKYKMLHFSWCINENVIDLKNQLNTKLDEIKIYEKYGR